MNINKKMLVFVSFVAAVTAGVMLFYAEEKENIKDERQVYVREENIEEPIPTEIPAAFTVCLVGNTVILYRIDNGVKTEVDSVEIDTNYYPDEDIKELTEGIPAYNIEEGYKILENFAN